MNSFQLGLAFGVLDVAQSKRLVARAALRAHARTDPYPITQPLITPWKKYQHKRSGERILAKAIPSRATVLSQAPGPSERCWERAGTHFLISNGGTWQTKIMPRKQFEYLYEEIPE